ncbi:hypothetical protein BP5796_06707 [Coleophoma crateriformis]|uniref:Uncharacterized protein n=1 Tax=Coleophoma crateriformis TaxID=565419 RepID=A0A3D8RPK5_9HELO|nr:hypothetical protein BP5796_06707 [Coleophoma crateriformis]
MSNDVAAASGRDTPVSKDGFTAPLQRRATPSSNDRYSIASNDTGESSTAGSKKSNLALNTADAMMEKNGRNSNDDVHPTKDSSHRRHRSRPGGFLLSNNVFDRAHAKPKPKSSITTYESHDDHKGKGKLQSPEKRHSRKRSNLGLELESSPLASNVTTAAVHMGEDVDDGGAHTMDDKAPSNTLDVDSAQIVHLALNLSESRRVAARRNISVPLSLGAGFTEGMGSSSLRQHLQQQRRASRNISPKPDKGERAVAASPRMLSAQKIGSPLQAAFESNMDDTYDYHFSASTLARAEKARTTIELMGQYRRLLQYLPPLKPAKNDRSSTVTPASTAPGSPTAATFSPTQTASSVNSSRSLGREYNPLQYIRNRKVRARERKVVDGEAQGFGDLGEVSAWIDRISMETLDDRHNANPLPVPTFSLVAKDAASPHASPQSQSRSAVSKSKRPRIDWIIHPADMIADIFWLEQEENKKLIEDRHGRKIFFRHSELSRPLSQPKEETTPQKSPPRDNGTPDLRIDTKMLPEFKSVKADSERQSDHAISRAKLKLRDATRFHHGHNGSHHRRVLSRSRSSSDSSDSDADSRRRVSRRRSGTADSQDVISRDILEKQMMEMLEKETRESEYHGPHDVRSQKIAESIDAQKSILREDLETSESKGHSRTASKVFKRHRKQDSTRNTSSGRASLEVPGSNPRSSIDGFDSTAPNSPEIRASKISGAFVPALGMELSPAPSRQSSPTRNPISRVRSKMNRLQERNASESLGANGIEDGFISRNSLDTPEGKESPSTPEKQKRSNSPVKLLMTRRTDDSQVSIRSRAGSLRGKSGEETSGIRGLFKSGRGAVSKVSDALWRKDASPGLSSGVSSDESDSDDDTTKRTFVNDSRARSIPPSDVEDASPKKERPSFLTSMPNFASPFERRGRERATRTDVIDAEEDNTLQEQQTKEHRDGAPRIDVQDASPRESPNAEMNGGLRLESDVSDLESLRNGYSNGVHGADVRLNAILGFAGKRRDQLPITGLTKLETSYDHRPSLESKRQWSISDREVSLHRGPMTKREIARVRALLLSSGIKAKEITRRSEEARSLKESKQKLFVEIAALAEDPNEPVPKSQEHNLAARILSNDIHLSARVLQSTTDNFCEKTVGELMSRAESLQNYIVQNLAPMARKASDDCDDVSKELVTSHMLAVKRLTDMMNKMLRRRRRRFRWLRRGGWVLVEWALVGIMWYVWFMVVLARIILGVFKGLWTL